MAEQICNQCESTHDPDTVSIPSPIPDKMCSECGTTLTDEQIATLINSLKINNTRQSEKEKKTMTDEITAEQIAQHYTAMGHSVDLINGIVDGTLMQDDDASDKQDCVSRNVEHLKIMVAKDFWTTEDMTAVNAAITAGEAYTA